MILRTYVVHATEPGRLPRAEDLLGTVQAKDHREARRVAQDMYPGRCVCVQLEGAVMLSEGAKPRKRPDYALIARINARRRR